jgi:hypothetical protein
MGFITIGSFLPLRDEFHPRRNQARQKLATLPSTRFKDLASDVYHELKRRYPQNSTMDEGVRILFFYILAIVLILIGFLSYLLYLNKSRLMLKHIQVNQPILYLLKE